MDWQGTLLDWRFEVDDMCRGTNNKAKEVDKTKQRNRRRLSLDRYKR